MNVVVGTHWTLRVPGGVQSHVRALVRALKDHGFGHVVVHPSDRYQRPWWRLYCAVKCLGDTDRGRLDLCHRRMADAQKTLRQELQSGRFHLIHAHDVLFLRGSLDVDLPKVLTIHGPLWHEVRMLMGDRSPRFAAFVKESEHLAYRGADAIITVDTNLRDLLVQTYGVEPPKIHVIANAVDTDWFAPDGDGEQLAPPYFLVPRRLVKKNGVAVSVEALARLRDPRVQLWIAGDGPERPALEDLVRRHRLDGRVRFLGAVAADGVRDLMRGALGIIVPSVPAEGVIEATSIAALEGMSMGKPVFASAIGGLAEIIRHGETGYLFPAGNAEALASLLEAALRDGPERMAEVGRRARAYVVEHHSLPVWFARIASVYREVVGRGDARARPGECADAHT